MLNVSLYMTRVCKRIHHKEWNFETQMDLPVTMRGEIENLPTVFTLHLLNHGKA